MTIIYLEKTALRNYEYGPVILYGHAYSIVYLTGGIKDFIIYLEMVHSGEVTKIKLKMARLFLIMDFLTPMTLNFYFPSHEVIFCQFPVIASTMVITKCVDSIVQFDKICHDPTFLQIKSSTPATIHSENAGTGNLYSPSEIASQQSMT